MRSSEISDANSEEDFVGTSEDWTIGNFLGIYRGSHPSVYSEELSDDLMVLGVSSEIQFLGIPSEISEGFPRKNEFPRSYFRGLFSSGYCSKLDDFQGFATGLCWGQNRDARFPIDADPLSQKFIADFNIETESGQKRHGNNDETGKSRSSISHCPCRHKETETKPIHVASRRPRWPCPGRQQATRIQPVRIVSWRPQPYPSRSPTGDHETCHLGRQQATTRQAVRVSSRESGPAPSWSLVGDQDPLRMDRQQAATRTRSPSQASDQDTARPGRLHATSPH
ncbi:hypothetical protein DY000_02002685 [Brassica cretica]|uniref:Uncharacterized protein n=1 Tax=Brassica cretica TaxID=69181 RepID=A0ABQ7CE32_BRACR|nr:hypothetical protein DY000_02002685 [Brassica cretica]